MTMIIIAAVVAAILTILKCVYQATSLKECYERSLPALAWAISIALHEAICVLLARYAGGEFLWAAILTCWIILGVIGLLSIFNREGEYRRDSWNCLILLYGAALLMCLAKRQDAGTLTTATIVVSVIIVIVVLFLNFFACYCYENDVFKAMREAKDSSR